MIKPLIHPLKNSWIILGPAQSTFVCPTGPKPLGTRGQDARRWSQGQENLDEESCLDCKIRFNAIIERCTHPTVLHQLGIKDHAGARLRYSDSSQNNRTWCQCKNPSATLACETNHAQTPHVTWLQLSEAYWVAKFSTFRKRHLMTLRPQNKTLSVMNTICDLPEIL